MKFSKSRTGMGGQVALIVLLVSAVVMTVGLSMSDKAVIETKIDTDEELLKQAFNAAESGIEYYRGMGSIDYETGDDRTSVIVTVNDVGGESQISLDGYVMKNKAVFFWMVGHKDDGSIDETDFYGGDSLSICTTVGFDGALKVDFYYKEVEAYKVKRKGFNLEGSGVVSGFVDDAIVTDGCIDVADLLVVGTTPLLLTAVPISGGTELRLVGSAGFPFPVQGEEIRAVGTVDEEDLGISQQVRVYDVYRIPAFMLEGITAGGSVLSE